MTDQIPILPFCDLTDEGLSLLNENDLPSSSDRLPSFETTSSLKSLPNLNDFDVDVHCPQSIVSRYFEVPELSRIIDDEHDLAILHTNIRSLSQHHDELVSLSTIRSKGFDVIGVSEIWNSIKNPIVTNVDIPGYTFYSTQSNSQNGGVGLYIRQSFVTYPRNDLNLISDDFEVIWVEVDNKRNKNYLFCCTYRHPNSDIENITSYFKTTLPTIANKNVFIMGDFNVNLLNYDSHNPSREFINNFFSHNYIPSIHHPTRVHEHSASVIDNIFTNSTVSKIICGNILTQISDHYPQFLILRNTKIFQHKSIVMKYDYSNFNQDEFIDDFQQMDFSYLESSKPNAELNYNRFLNDITELVNKNAPIIKCTKGEIKLRNKPWISKPILKMMRLRDRIHKQLRIDKSDDTLSLYKKFRNRVTYELRKSKIDYFQNYFSCNTNNMKKLWSGIKLIINPKSSLTSFINKIKDLNGVATIDPVEISNIFNNYFANISNEITKNIPSNPKSPLDYLLERNDKSMFLSPVTNVEIENIISIMNPTKSVGPHSIPVRLLKILGPFISIPLAKVVNQSFQQGTFPSKLKTAKIIALFKKGDPESPSNYRPISLLSVFSKIFEKLMYKQLYSFFTSLKLIYPYQFGFLQNHSIDHALISLTEKIKHTLDNRRLGCGVFIDLQKAFDTVNHNVLLSKLEHYGVRGVALNWFVSYLSKRQQFVCINNISSDMLPIECGVPQGSILGPLLFLIFINDLPNVSTNLKFYLFADDTNIYYESDDINTLLLNINRELKSVKRWLDVNRLALNVQKTNYIIFHSSATTLNSLPGVKFGKGLIQRVKFIRFLGVLLDENVSWKHHLSELSKKLARTCGILSKTRHLLPTNILICLFNSLFMSFLSYGIIVWGQTFPSFIEPIFILQKRAVRTISAQPLYSNSAVIFRDLNLLRLSDVFILKLMTFVYESVHKLSPSCFHNFFKMNFAVHHHNTRQANRGDLFRSRWNSVSFGRMSIQHLGPKLWNDLPLSVRDSSNKYSFKKNCKRYLLSLNM